MSDYRIETDYLPGAVRVTIKGDFGVSVSMTVDCDGRPPEHLADEMKARMIERLNLAARGAKGDA